jgi:hypothetical protein
MTKDLEALPLAFSLRRAAAAADVSEDKLKRHGGCEAGIRSSPPRPHARGDTASIKAGPDQVAKSQHRWIILLLGPVPAAPVPSLSPIPAHVAGLVAEAWAGVRMGHMGNAAGEKRPGGVPGLTNGKHCLIVIPISCSAREIIGLTSPQVRNLQFGSFSN